jgi:two-component system response regulator AtoC
VDLPLLIDYFLDLYSKTYRLEPKPISREITTMMQRYTWPGNIRQLENMIRSYVLIGTEESLAAELLSAVPVGIVPEIDLANPISLKEVTRAATRGLERDHPEGAAGEWVESPQDGQVAQYKLSIASL